MFLSVGFCGQLLCKETAGKRVAVFFVEMEIQCVRFIVVILPPSNKSSLALVMLNFLVPSY
jgi:hypothetical protein